MKEKKIQEKIFKLVATLWVLTFPLYAKTQNITAYEDYKDYFFVFDNGVKTQLDYRKVHAYQVGYSSVAYLNSLDELWVYQNGKHEKVIEWSKTFRQTDNFLVFGDNGFLNVYDNGKTHLLSSQVGPFAFGDSIVTYFDIQNQALEIYYNHQTFQIETDLLQSPKFAVGENNMAYLSPQNYFMAFQNGKIEEIMYTDEHINFKLGLDIIAFIKPEIESFFVFQNGEETEIEENPPQSYKCGDRMVVYVNLEDELIQYYKGEKFEISSFSPAFYKVVDDMVVYGLQDRLYTFYNGENYELTNYIPSNYQVDKGSVAYIDQQGKLWLFNKGKQVQVSTERVTDFKLSGNTIHYDVGLNTHEVYFEGKAY